MLDDLLRGAFRLAHRRLGVVFLDLVWKAIWFALTATALLLVAAWFGLMSRSIAWLDTGNRSADIAVGIAVVREFWEAHRDRVFLAVATVLFASLVIWFVLEAAFRAKICPPPLGEGGAPLVRRVRVSRLGETCDPRPARQPAGCRADLSQGERFGTFLVASVLKCLFLTNAAFAFGAICFSRYFVSPFAEWGQMWPDTRGAALIVVLTLAALGFLLTTLETLVRSDAIELLGTDLFRVAGLIGILLLFETMISGSCALMVGVGFLSVSGWRDALLMLGTAAVGMAFMTVLHSYLLVVRFSAVVIMRQNVVEV